MNYFVLASGSTGNATVVETNKTTVLIDVGVNKTYLNKALMEIGLILDDIDAVLITHSHSDHIKGLKAIEGKKIYSSFDLKGNYNETLIEPYVPFEIKDLKILPIKLSHDAKEVVGFILESDETLVYITDTGFISNQNLELIKGKEYYIIEANHDPVMLMNSKRPNYIKARIISDYGHMNNEDTGVILANAINNNTKEIVLAHLSKEANTPELAINTVKSVLNEYGLYIKGLDIKVALPDGIVSGGSDD